MCNIFQILYFMADKQLRKKITSKELQYELDNYLRLMKY